MGVLLFYFELFIFGRAGSSLRRRHPSSCVELRPLKQGWVGFSGAALVGGAYWGVALLWAGLAGCCPLVGRASQGLPSCGRGWKGAALLWAGLSGAQASAPSTKGSVGAVP